MPKHLECRLYELLRAIDEGNAGLNIPAYNGGLFALDPALDALQVPDEVCAHLKELGDYDYRPAREVADASEFSAAHSVIDVDILGHIFEQSITDIDRLPESLSSAGFQPAVSPTSSRQAVDDRAACGLETRDTAGWKPAPRGEPGMVGRRRKQEGAVYTPAFITRYLVEQALCGVLNPRFETLRRRHEADAARTARFFGTIQTCNLVVEAGAVIVGTVRIGRPGSGPDTATSGSP